MCLFTNARIVAIVFARSAGSEAMYCAGVLTFDVGCMDSGSPRTECITEVLKTSHRQIHETTSSRRLHRETKNPAMQAGFLLPCRSKTLHPDHAHQLFPRVAPLLQGSFLAGSQLDLNDFLDAGRTELARHADIESVDAVFAFEIGSAWKDLLLVLQDGFDHFGRRRRRRIVSAAGLEVLNDLGAPVSHTLHHFLG